MSSRYYTRPIRFVRCAVCGGEFGTNHPQRKYCGRECANRAQKMNVITQPRPFELPTGTVGALSELKAAVYLMEQGYNVFRALSPHCPFDLCAFRLSEVLRVEVTTGHRYRRASSSYTGKFFSTTKINRLLRGDFDALVTVFDDSVEIIKTKEDVARFKGMIDEEPVE